MVGASSGAHRSSSHFRGFPQRPIRREPNGIVLYRSTTRCTREPVTDRSAPYYAAPARMPVAVPRGPCTRWWGATTHHARVHGAARPDEPAPPGRCRRSDPRSREATRWPKLVGGNRCTCAKPHVSSALPPARSRPRKSLLPHLIGLGQRRRRRGGSDRAWQYRRGHPRGIRRG